MMCACGHEHEDECLCGCTIPDPDEDADDGIPNYGNAYHFRRDSPIPTLLNGRKI
jgi:hypothetical protein